MSELESKEEKLKRLVIIIYVTWSIVLFVLWFFFVVCVCVCVCFFGGGDLAFINDS